MITQAGREAWQTMSQLTDGGRRHRRAQEVAAQLGITPGVLRALFSLQPGVGVPMRDLARICHCDASYVTSLADELERRGLVNRMPHATDRRIKMLVVTEEGIAARDRAHALFHAPPAWLARVPAEQQRNLRDLLRGIAEAYTESAPDGYAEAAAGNGSRRR